MTDRKPRTRPSPLKMLSGAMWTSMSDVFPQREVEYDDSRWGMWEERIRQGHDAEAALIRRTFESRNGPVNNDVAADDYLTTCHVTDAMYAALIVAIWAEIEHFLRNVVKLCRSEFRIPTLRLAQQFCADSLAKTPPSITLADCIKKLQRLDDKRSPYKFHEFKVFLKNEVGIDVEQCVDCRIVNAIRILNNSFKHNNCRYKPEPKEPHTVIDGALLKRWQILKPSDDIDYSKLPLKELVIACHVFCDDLLKKTVAALGQKATQRTATKPLSRTMP